MRRTVSSCDEETAESEGDEDTDNITSREREREMKAGKQADGCTGL
jgi:hypothetical protein